jgi:hypothetical protein
MSLAGIYRRVSESAEKAANFSVALSATVSQIVTVGAVAVLPVVLTLEARREMRGSILHAD